MVADGAAHLEGGTLPSGGAAAQMGQDRAQKDGRQQPDGQALAQMDLIDDVIGSLALGLRQLVKAHNDQPRRRQAPQQPRVLRPQDRGVVNTDMK